MADTPTPGDTPDPTGKGFSLGQFLGKLFEGDGSSSPSPMGAFDPEQFVNANLARAQVKKGGVGIKDVTQGIAQLLGVGKGHEAGSPQPSPDDGAPLVAGVKPTKMHASHALDFLQNVLTTLGSDPNQGGQ